MKKLLNIKLILILFFVVQIIALFTFEFTKNITIIIFLILFDSLYVAGFVIIVPIIFQWTNRSITDNFYTGFDSVLRFTNSEIIMLDYRQKIIWVENGIDSGFSFKVGQSITKYLPEFKKLKKNSALDILIEKNNNIYKVKYLKTANILIFKNESSLVNALLSSRNNQTIIGYIKVDNYRDITDHISEQELLKINIIVQNEISAWANKHQFLVKVINPDTFIIVGSEKHLEDAKKEKFSFAEVIKIQSDKINQDITLSMGFGGGVENIFLINNLALEGLEKSEKRGGDQIALVNYGEDIEYMGGHSESKTIKTKIKIKKFAKKIINEIKNSKNVIVCGHKHGDYDAIAAGLALASLARSFGKDAKTIINIDGIDTKAKRYISEYLGKNYISENILKPANAVKFIKKDTLIIVVDTSVPTRIEVPEILNISNRIIVLDHHRSGKVVIKNVIAEYIDPGSSSTSEIVTEILEFTTQEISLTSTEINLLYTGIVLDTDNFKSTRVGPRTFQAAGALKLWGADQTIAKSLLKDTYEEYVLKSKIIANAKRVNNKFILATVPNDIKKHTSFIAQIAQETLDIEGVSASFVICYNRQGVASASARSDGSINVQVIMEELGGGGHFNAAATQQKESTIKELETKIYQKIKGA